MLFNLSTAPASVRGTYYLDGGSTREQTLTVPEEAVVVAESGNALFVAERGRGALVARRRTVELGVHGAGRVEILRGLSPGDKVVVGGAALLTSGDPIVGPS